MSIDTPTTSKAMFWAGCVMSALPVLMMVMGAATMFLKPEMATEGMKQMGYPPEIGPYLVIVELICVAFYLVPQTSVLGAILLTGYLGGATATHVRVGELPTMAIVVGVLVWGGLFLRDARIRALIPWKR